LAAGGNPARQRALLADRALSALALKSGLQTRFAVVAVGGYGRRELSPHSDIDILVLRHPRDRDPGPKIRSFLYPLWDSGLVLGHAVVTPKQAVARAERDLRSATALLSFRLVEGDPELFEELAGRAGRWKTRQRRTLAKRIAESVAERHRRVDRAGWTLAPELKEDRGGLRDAHVAGWFANLAGAEDDPAVVGGSEVLLAVREALHAIVARRTDRLHIDLQPQVAQELELDAGTMMEAVHSAARSIEHHGGLAGRALLETLTGGPKRSGTAAALGEGIMMVDGLIAVDGEPSPERGLRLAQAIAATGKPLSSGAVPWLAAAFSARPRRRWSREARVSFLQLLRGPHAAQGLEALDHAGAWESLLPEWLGIRGLAQQDPYHRYTVDGHSFLAVEEVTRALRDDHVAKVAAPDPGDLDILYLAALLHDVGKGSGEDHCTAGERIARAICKRMDVDDDIAVEVARLVRLHLLLSDTATRRDLDDGSVIAEVTDAVGEPGRLRQLYVLSIADGKSTGPEAWNDWKASLVADLFRKAIVALETGRLPERQDLRNQAAEIESYEPVLAGRVAPVLETLPPSYLDSSDVQDAADDMRFLLDPPKRGEIRFRVEAGESPPVVTACVRDAPGTLARTAGVLALHRVSVMRAHAYSTSMGLALQRFVVAPPPSASWEEIEIDLAASYSGRFALEARLDGKIRDYLTHREVQAEVQVLGDASRHSTVIEVRAPDFLGLLYELAAALAQLDLDIHVAKIDTLGARVVDVFYVRTLQGEKLTQEHAAEVERAIRHRIERLTRL
jgi:[protein-PII] uridylyltransferase